MNEQLRVGLIGAGMLGQTYLEALKSLEEVKLVAVADSSSERRATVAEAYSVEVHPSVEDMLQRTRIDAVVLCTPPVSHVEIALKCIKQNVHLLCEKPLALSSSDAERMIYAADERKVILMMASKFRYVPELMKAKALINAGVVGNVISFDNAFCSYVDMRHRWNATPAVSGGGVIVDNGTHSIDITRYLLGPIAQVLAIRGALGQDVEVEDTACILIKTKSAAVGIIQLSWSINRHLDNFVSIYGTSGTLHVGWDGLRYRLIDKLQWEKFGNGYNKIQAIRAQTLNFIPPSISNRWEVKINAMVYILAAVIIEDFVMISAGAVLTNDKFPRAFSADLSGLASSEPTEQTLRTVIHKGVTIGANATIGCGIELGEFSMVGMGSVVTRRVLPHSLVYGNPARHQGYVCTCGCVLFSFDGSEPSEVSEKVTDCYRFARTFRLSTDLGGTEIT